MDLPTAGVVFAGSYLTIGVIAALAAAVVASVTWAWVLSARLSRLARQLRLETSRRRRLQIKVRAARSDLEQRVRERTEALETRNEELSRVRLLLETANQRLKRLVAVDALTGIANRRHFDRVLDRELRRARREQLPLSLIFLDLDDFKRFNDTFGHTQGDEVLRRVALTLDETFRRGGDLVARYGGEEFAVVLPGVDTRRASLYAERLRRRIWRLAITHPTSAVGDRITISAGVATLSPGLAGFHNATPDGLLRAADQALYRAKCLGRNRVSMAGGARDVARVELAS